LHRCLRWGLVALTIGILVGASAWGRIVRAQTPAMNTRNGEWPTYGGDLANTHYSPIDQINASNFSQLEIAWRFKTNNLGPRPEFKLEGTPLVVNGVAYTTGGTRRAAIALNAQTGELKWVHGEPEGARGAAGPRQLSGRGLGYWSDGRDERILYTTIGFRLIALDAKTGSVVPSVGKNGVVDLKEAATVGNGRAIDLVNGEIGVASAPTITQ